MEAKERAIGGVLRRLGAAMKTYVLYPPPSVVADRATTTLLEELRAYTGSHGPFIARVLKRAFVVDGLTFKDATDGRLAFHLYTRRIMHLKLLPGVSQEELTTYLSIVGRDRTSLEAAGGVAHLLWQAKVENIKVAEMVLAQEGIILDEGSSQLAELLGQEWLAPEDRERVIETLQAGPQEVSQRLLDVPAGLGGVAQGDKLEERVQQIYSAIRDLDRLILDEPFENQPELYANLAAALVLFDEPLRTSLFTTLAARADEDPTARVLLDHLSRHRLAEAVPNGLPTGTRPADQAEAPQLPIADFQKFTLPPGVAAGISEPLAYRFEEGGADEASVIREVAATLVDVLRADDDEGEMRDIAGALEGYLPWLVDHQEFGLLLKILAGVKDAASGAADSVRELAAALLQSLAGESLIEKLLEALWRNRETEHEQEIQACLEIFADDLIGPLMRILSVEVRAGMRAMLCDIIVDVGRDRVDEIGRFTSDGRWYLVRNAANILGRLGGSRAVVYLARLAGHPEYRVRREALDALLRIGTPEAESHLPVFLDDPDENLRMRTLQSLSDAEVRLSLPKLLELLERRDSWHRHFLIKEQVIAALARARVQEALPILNRLARQHFLFNRRGRELRRLAQSALASIGGREPAGKRRFFFAGRGEAGRGEAGRP